MPKVAIIVLNWNGWRDTIGCLESLSGLDYDNFEVILIDNGSSDESVQKIEEYKRGHSGLPSLFGEGSQQAEEFRTLRPQQAEKSNELKYFRIYSNKANLGFAGGNNVGIKEALRKGADYVLLLNNDTTVDKNFLKELVKVGEGDKKIGILGPLIYFFDEPEKIWFAGGKINWLRTRGEHIAYDKTLNVYSSSDPALSGILKKGRGNREVMFSASSNNKIVDYISGCCLLIKKQVIDKIGLMDKDYFLYYEDADWCLRAKKAGYKCVLVPQAKIYHKVSQSVAKLPSHNYIYYHTRNGLRMAWKLGSWPKRLFLIGWIKWLLAKQLIKLIIGYKKEWARAVIAGVGDFVKGGKGEIKF